MDLGNQVCKPYWDEFVIIFIDDILICSKTKEGHEQHLRAILELLKKEQLYAKVRIWIRGVQIPRSHGERGWNPCRPCQDRGNQELGSTKNHNRDMTISGLAGYYKRFIEDLFSEYYSAAKRP
ncbi:uncharacterized protein LOC110924590 [Helianthus annuus]|uniref:uncharacterized protein LOC110924590 n=1 Tax=Helianthus annuus TaxID=4232 RepID=UPI000B8F1A90|nr:uncharacterized protein LOC110924590 [Helianthus annuus]